MVAAIWGSIPSPSSGVLTIGPLELRAYGLMIALGVVAGVWLLGRRLESAGIGTRDDAASIALWAVPAGIVGARLYHVATDWERFSDDPADIVKIWQGGLGIPGGMALGIIVGVWAAHRRHLPLGPTLTAVAPCLPLAQAIGRWGNWFNQELFGRPTSLPWALEVSDEKAIAAGYPPGTTFHPTFLYESLWNFALCGLLLWIDKRFKLRPGRLLAVYVLGYGIGRFWVEALRIDPAKEGAGLRLNQWMALVLIAGSAGFLIVDHLRHRNDPPPAEPDGDEDEAVAEDEAVGEHEELVVEDLDVEELDGDAIDDAEASDVDDVEELAAEEDANRPREIGGSGN